MAEKIIRAYVQVDLRDEGNNSIGHLSCLDEGWVFYPDEENIYGGLSRQSLKNIRDIIKNIEAMDYPIPACIEFEGCDYD